MEKAFAIGRGNRDDFSGYCRSLSLQTIFWALHYEIKKSYSKYEFKICFLHRVTAHLVQLEEVARARSLGDFSKFSLILDF